MPKTWPSLDFAAWRDTGAALHLYTQIVGKYRLAHSPWVNHSWHATFYVNSRGLTTALIPDGVGGIEIHFDLVDHAVAAWSADGRTARFELGPMSVAEFHGRFVELVRELDGRPVFHGRPNEVIDAVPFTADRAPRPYDADAVSRFFQALVRIDRVLQRFRTGFIGKVSPVHLFWGSFDLAVTRFSGRPAPLHPGGVPNLPDEITREAYSHEVSSAGFWPGGGAIDYAAFYAYAYPATPGFSEATVAPAEAFYHEGLGEFVLPYDAVRASGDPEGTLLAFLDATYGAAAELGRWERRALDCPLGEPRRPRPLAARAEARSSGL